MTRTATLALLSAILVCSLVTDSSAQSTYPVINVGYKEIRLVPEDFGLLVEEAPVFGTNPVLSTLLEQNSTMFWEALGQFGSDLGVNSSAYSYSVVQINDTGIFITVVGLGSGLQSVEWIDALSPTITENYSLIVDKATDFFNDDGHYWGLCEEIMVLPGGLVERTEAVVWRLVFHLVAEGERWTLLYSTNGVHLDTLSIPVPCQSCDYSPYVILGVSGTISAIIVIGVLRKRATVS
jgi:hypothetical protein